MKRKIFAVSSKCEFGKWNHIVHCFTKKETAKKWLETEKYDFTAAIKLAGRKSVEMAERNALENR